MKYIFIILVLCFLGSLQAQVSVGGRVTDATTGESLPFVHLVFNGDPSLGTTSDIDGMISYTLDAELRSIRFSYLGYVDQTIHPEAIEDPMQLDVRMEPAAVGLDEVVVIAGENPAHRIILEAAHRRSKHNPANLETFSYDSYVKTTASIIPLAEDSMGSKKLPLGIKFGESLEHVMVAESVIRRKYKAPTLNEERIIGNRVSGFKEPLFASVITTLEPFSFYQDIISVGEDDFVNPITNGAEKKYFFQLVDTLYDKGDTVFVISYEPKRGKNFNALRGLLHIHGTDFAIKNMIVEPAIPGFLNFRIQQTFEYMEDRHWFPTQFYYEVIQSVQGQDGLVGVRISSRYAFSDIAFDLNLEKNDFSEVEVVLEDSSSKRDEEFWNRYRPESLTSGELDSYKVLDSLGDEMNLDNLIFIFAKVLQARLPIGPVDVLLNRLIAKNEFENFRLGIGLETNERLHPHLSVGGYVAYGLGDSQWKYGSHITYRWDKVRETALTAGIDHQLRPIGVSGLNIFNRGVDWSVVAADRLDQIDRYHLSFQHRPIRYTLLKVGANNTKFRPLLMGDVSDASENYLDAYTNTEFSVGIRYAFKEKLIQSLNQIIAVPSKYPVATVVFTKGIKGFLESDFDYNKIEATLDQTIRWKYMGKTHIRLAGGMVDRSVPTALRFSGEGSNFSFLPFFVPYTFQTAEPYEFLSDEYGHIFFRHDFHDLLLQIGRFKPHLSIYHNMGWGNIKHVGEFESVGFRTKENGYFESGIQLDNLVRFNVASLGYLGFGVATFYRYGPYAYSEERDNIAINFSLGWTSR